MALQFPQEKYPDCQKKFLLKIQTLPPPPKRFSRTTRPAEPPLLPPRIKGIEGLINRRKETVTSQLQGRTGQRVRFGAEWLCHRRPIRSSLLCRARSSGCCVGSCTRPAWTRSPFGSLRAPASHRSSSRFA